MATEVVMPRLGWNMEEGAVASWRRKSGEAVTAGQVLFEVESDKATQEVEALEGGVLHIPGDSPATGTMVPVGTVLAWLLAPGEAPPAALPARPSAAPAAAPGGPAASGPAPTAHAETAVPRAAARREAAPATASRRRVAISPRARRAAGQVLHVDWTRIHGSGSTGRIIERDVREAAARQATAAPGGATAGAFITLGTEADATELVRLQAQLGGASQAATLALVLRVTAEALREFPGLAGGRGRPMDMAVAVGRAGDMASTLIRDAGSLPLRDLLAAVGSFAPGDMAAATFAIVDLGSRDIDFFTPRLPGIACPTLGLGRITSRRTVAISFGCSEELADLDTGSRFLQAVKRNVENPWLCLAGP